MLHFIVGAADTGLKWVIYYLANRQFIIDCLSELCKIVQGALLFCECLSFEYQSEIPSVIVSTCFTLAQSYVIITFLITAMLMTHNFMYLSNQEPPTI